MIKRYGRRFAGVLFLCVLASRGQAAAMAFEDSGPPRTFILNPRLLAASKARVEAGEAPYRAGVEELAKQADKALAAGPFTVTDKPFMPPSGDKRDYMSLSIYWWPNPLTKYPYIHRDGRRNPEADEYDGARIAPMCNAVHSLALAYYFTGREAYAERAAHLLRVWFLDEETGMHPNMNYAQGIPGLCSGARQGVIEAVPMATKVVDAVGLIGPSAAWTEAEQAALEAWFARFLEWLQTSRLGRQEGKRNNNHGVWYDVQIAALAMFTGQESLARETLQGRTRERILDQIEPDGRQPAELKRTKSFDYSCYNLDALFHVAFLGQRVGVDLWDLEGGPGIQKALAFLASYIDQADKWPYEQIYDFDPAGRLYPFIHKAAAVFDDPECRRLLITHPELAGRAPTGMLRLAYPPRE